MTDPRVAIVAEALRAHWWCPDCDPNSSPDDYELAGHVLAALDAAGLPAADRAEILDYAAELPR